MKNNIKIPCLHERGAASNNERVNDYFPLNREEISYLLDLAARNWMEGIYISEVQVRLVQGIKGMTCPRPAQGSVAERMGRLEKLFVDRYKEGARSGLVDELYQIMNET